VRTAWLSISGLVWLPCLAAVVCAANDVNVYIVLTLTLVALVFISTVVAAVVFDQ